MVNKLRRIERTEVDENVTDVIMRANPKRYLRYAQVQAKFLAWCSEHQQGGKDPSGIPIIKFWLTAIPD
jgi:hypothetical protein